MDGGVDSRVQIVAVVVTVMVFVVVLELVRRRRLVERYALLWMFTAVALMVLAIWTDLLGELADLVGIEVPANFLFLAAFGVAFLLLLHFSVATSRLSDETKILAQEVARLDHELRAVRGDEPGGNGAGPDEAGARGDQAQPGSPSSRRAADQ